MLYCGDWVRGSFAPLRLARPSATWHGWPVYWPSHVKLHPDLFLLEMDTLTLPSRFFVNRMIAERLAIPEPGPTGLDRLVASLDALLAEKTALEGRLAAGSQVVVASTHDIDDQLE